MSSSHRLTDVSLRGWLISNGSTTTRRFSSATTSSSPVALSSESYANWAANAASLFGARDRQTNHAIVLLEGSETILTRLSESETSDRG
jgi:hypothetical protein